MIASAIHPQLEGVFLWFTRQPLGASRTHTLPLLVLPLPHYTSLYLGKYGTVALLYHQRFFFPFPSSFSHQLFPPIHLLSRSINMFTAAMVKISEIYTFPLIP